MTNNFKPGDLALIVGCYRDPSDIGKCVELIEFVPAGREYLNEQIHPGRAHLADTDGWVCSSPNIVSFSGVTGFALYQANHLAPLRGDFAPEQQKSQEVSA